MRILLPLVPFAFCAASAHAQLTILDTQVNPANGHTYHLLEESTWTAAEAEAVALGGHLVTINDAAENSWVYSTFGGFGGQGRDLWIGLNDVVTEGVYVWTSGQNPGYLNWAPGQPDNNGGATGPGEDYVHIYSIGSIWYPEQWNDMFDALPGTAGWSPGYFGVVEVEGMSLTITGSCPGPAQLAVAQATPNGIVYIGYSVATGSLTLPGGPCPGTTIDLLSPTLAFALPADANGMIALPVNLPPGACGNVHVQAIDRTTCQVSPLVSL